MHRSQERAQTSLIFDHSPVRSALWARATNLIEAKNMPESLPFVTIVVPTLNEERYIEACLRSLIDSVRDIRCEILVVDGGSSDRTVELATRCRQVR